MSLPVALVLNNFPADLVLELDVAFCVPVGVPAIMQDFTMLSYCI